MKGPRKKQDGSKCWVKSILPGVRSDSWYLVPTQLHESPAPGVGEGSGACLPLQTPFTFTHKGNKMEKLFFDKKSSGHQGPCHGNQMASIILPIRAGAPPTQSAKFHQTVNTSVLEEQEHRRIKEADHADLLQIVSHLSIFPPKLLCMSVH
jgi:hypothetical protein